MFSSQKAYAHLIGRQQVHRAFSWLWKSCSQNKRKVFFWLLLKDRLNTRNLLRRKTMFLEDYNCAICMHSVEETLQHLFLDCPFVATMWNTLGLIVHHTTDPLDIFVSFRTQLNVPFFMEIIISMCWAIWSVHNDSIFRHLAPSVQSGKCHFKLEFPQVILRAKGAYKAMISQWLQVYV
jgi:hypothetical protein